MASTSIYPPVVDSYMPAFIASGGSTVCAIRFSLSKFSASAQRAHVMIMKQSTGVSCVNTADWYDSLDTPEGVNPLKRCGSYGIILNVPIHIVEGEPGLREIWLGDKDVSTKRVVYSSDGKTITTQTGFIPGWVYKVQIRLDGTKEEDVYRSDSGISVASWLKEHSSDFSEWSTVCIVKPTGKPNVLIPNLSIVYPQEGGDGNNSLNATTQRFFTTFDLHGRYGNADATELLKSYRIRLYSGEQSHTINGWTFDDSQLLEDSGIKTDVNITKFSTEDVLNEYENNLLSVSTVGQKEVINYLNKYYDTGENTGKIWWTGEFNYVLATEATDGETYTVRFNFETINGLAFEVAGTATISEVLINKTEVNLNMYTVGSESGNVDLASVDEENNEGRIAVYFTKGGSDNTYSGNVCIRRTDETSNFNNWHDIKIKVFKQTDITTDGDGLNKNVFYDYTAESGKWYLYGIQDIDRDGNRGVMKQMGSPTIRNYAHSFLLGGDGRQLKLMFDNTMDSFKINRYDSKVDTIGGKYPIISRNSSVDYKTFPINGLISFWMDDDNKLFYTKEEAYKAKYGKGYSIKDKYTEYNDYYRNVGFNNIDQYDYFWEKAFRDKVLEWLHDGTPKLFKSPTEGNVIVRLMDINCTPNQSLGRMIYSFSATAHEIAEANYDNLVKYGFIKVGNYAQDFAVYKTKLGQLTGEFNVRRTTYYLNDETGEISRTNIQGDNIFKMIYDKYDTMGQNSGGYVYNLQQISGMRIEVHNQPWKISYSVHNNYQSDSIDDFVMGTSFIFNNQKFNIIAPRTVYEFDDRISYNVEGDADGVTPELVFLGASPEVGNSVIDESGGVTSSNRVESLIKQLWTERKALRLDLSAIGGAAPQESQESYYVDKYNMYYPDFLEYYDKKMDELDTRIAYLCNGGPSTVDATIDFLYKMKEYPYLGPRYRSITSKRQLGQIYQRMEVPFEEYSLNQTGMLTNGIINELKSRYYLYSNPNKITEQNNRFSKLSSLLSIEIEANPGAIFAVVDEFGEEQHIMNETGVLTLYDIKEWQNVIFKGYAKKRTAEETQKEKNRLETLRDNEIEIVVTKSLAPMTDDEKNQKTAEITAKYQALIDKLNYTSGIQTTYQDYDRVTGLYKSFPVWCDVMCNYIAVVSTGTYMTDDEVTKIKAKKGIT